MITLLALRCLFLLFFGLRIESSGKRRPKRLALNVPLKPAHDIDLRWDVRSILENGQYHLPSAIRRRTPEPSSPMQPARSGCSILKGGCNSAIFGMGFI
jgi:hypothetical protein